MRTLAIAALLALGACASAEPEPDPMRVLTFRSTATINESRPLYIVVRSVDEGAFMQESYTTVAGKVVPAEKDETLRGVRFAWPGHEETLVVNVADDEAFAVYALFTNPRDPWKLLVQPPLRKEYGFVLEDGTLSLSPERPRRPAER